ncbi:hypothetical protein [Spirosoma luteolum]
MSSEPTIHCPYCGTANDYHAQVCKKCGKDISQVSRPPLQQASTPPPVSTAADTVKFSTVVLLVLCIPLLFPPVTLIGIGCGVAAYYSYKSPNKSWPF